MNVVAHLVVAGRVTGLDPDADEVFGAVLPDLASMAGLRIDRAQLPAGVAAGVAVHHRTDACFHGHPWFVAAMRDDAADLRRAGLPRGPSRASAHVGIELLLDGVLLDDSRVRGSVEAFVASLDVDRLGEGGVAHRAGWERLFARMGDGSLADAYGSAEAVADRVDHALARRPRLALDAIHRPTLVDQLASRQVDVHRVAAAVVDEVVEAVRRDSGSPGRAA
jgi:hypothetical protein